MAGLRVVPTSSLGLSVSCSLFKGVSSGVRSLHYKRILGLVSALTILAFLEESLK